VTTVGYGDISPRSTVARLIVLCITIVGFSLIPVEVSALIEAMRKRPKYMGSLVLTKQTILIAICGRVDYELLSRFLTELFHPTHSPSNISRRIIVAIMAPSEPSKQVLVLLRLPQYKGRVFYFIGSSKSSLDLRRIVLERYSCFNSAFCAYHVNINVTYLLKSHIRTI
jgi:hypothetical protein